MVLAGMSHWFTLRRLQRGESPVLNQWPLSITLAMLSACIGLAGLWALGDECQSCQVRFNRVLPVSVSTRLYAVTMGLG